VYGLLHDYCLLPDPLANTDTSFDRCATKATMAVKPHTDDVSDAHSPPKCGSTNWANGLETAYYRAHTRVRQPGAA
jgi:hypothetical protein